MYVVAGVSGHTGKVVAEALLARGEKVRVIVRDAAKGQAFAARGAEVAVADLEDAGALATALSGAKGAYLLAPPNFAAADFRAYQRAVGEAIASAVGAAKVPHVVFLSSIGAELPSGTGPIAGLHGIEAALSAIAGTATTFIRAGWFMENAQSSFGALAQGILPGFFPADFEIDMATTRDIGELASVLLIEGATKTSVVQLGGPGVSWNALADAIGRVTGKRPNVIAQPADGMGKALEGYGVPAQMAALYEEMTQAMIAGTIKFHDGFRHVRRARPLEADVRALLG